MAVKKIAVTLPEELYEMVERARKIEHRTRSELIQEALRTHFGEPVYHARGPSAGAGLGAVLAQRPGGHRASAMNLLLRPAAVADLQAARKYYEEARPGLAEDLVEDLDRLFARLKAFPRSAPSVAGYEPVRRALLRRFPYAVFYRPDAAQIDILRIVHTARSPGAWRISRDSR
jgi:plasmid stabilization system protein ParE